MLAVLFSNLLSALGRRRRLPKGPRPPVADSERSQRNSKATASVRAGIRMDNNAQAERRKLRKSRGIPESLLAAVFLLAVLFLPGYRAAEITWTPDLEWERRGNWAEGFVPENGSHVVFPVEMWLSVGLPTRTGPLEIAGLELPRDGALVLPETGSLTISEAISSTKTASWSLEGPLFWTDPANWNSERSVEATPHLERIPCQQDIVVLPAENQTFNIRLPNALGTKVRAVKTGKEQVPMSNWEWRLALRQREFVSGPMTVEYVRLQGCDDCPCQQESIARQLLEEVCAVVSRPKCGDPVCEYPVTVEGHCCYYCGGRVRISDRSSLSLIRKMTNDALTGFSGSLTWYARRTWNSRAEVLIAGKNGAYSMVETEDAMAALIKVLEDQGIEVLGSEATGAPLRMSKATMILGPIFGALIIVGLVLLVVFPYFGYSLPEMYHESLSGLRVMARRERGANNAAPPVPSSSSIPKPFRFARFENVAEPDVELIDSSAAVTAEDRDDEAEEGFPGETSGGRFTNPLYRSGRKTIEEAPSFAALVKAHEDLDEEVDLTITS